MRLRERPHQAARMQEAGCRLSGGGRFDLAVTMNSFGSASMSFLMHAEIYQSDDLFRFGGRKAMVTRRPPAHRLDESPSRLFLGKVALQQSLPPLHRPNLF